MKRISIIGSVIIGLGLSACSMVQRHAGSGYSDFETSHYERGDYDERGSTRTLSGEERENFEVRYRLKRLESSIGTESERKQYFRIKPFLASDKERIEYLSLKDARARDRYIQSQGYAETTKSVDRYIAGVVEQGDIMVGMPKDAVEASWGKPLKREIAGSAEFENERWIYNEQVVTNDGFKDETRTIYFEGGFVTGWETSKK
jgi:hypothetical protein